MIRFSLRRLPSTLSLHPKPFSHTPNPNPTFESIKPSLFVPPTIPLAAVTERMVLPWSNIVLGPSSGDAKVETADLVGRSARARDCPGDHLPEFAVVGRSNVGKSSLVNVVLRRREIARTSKKPGKTQLINHFLVNKSWYLVDLPGFGFANVSQSARLNWSTYTKEYFLKQDNLVGVLLLVDANVPAQKIDIDCANWLGDHNIGITVVFTKCDKIRGSKGSRSQENIRTFQEIMRRYYQEPVPWIMTSSVTGLNRDELLLHMSQLRNYWGNHHKMPV